MNCQVHGSPTSSYTIHLICKFVFVNTPVTCTRCRLRRVCLQMLIVVAGRQQPQLRHGRSKYMYVQVRCGMRYELNPECSTTVSCPCPACLTLTDGSKVVHTMLNDEVSSDSSDSIWPCCTWEPCPTKLLVSLLVSLACGVACPAARYLRSGPSTQTNGELRACITT
jgi:hypothetical protein